VRAVRVTNRRWALSAFGTASSAAIGPGDTVYSVSALYHASALLTSIGAAVAGGGRLAMAAAYDPATFWDEVRRYGVTVASYTWTMLRDLVLAPRHPGEAHHPLRLFIGSGMPPGLWRRVMTRFAPARVLEFYASSEGEGVLVNLSGTKAGAVGRPLPGSAEVRLAAYDLAADRLVEGEGGYALRCPPGAIGLLLTRTDAGSSPQGDVLRSVFDREDAWLSTGDLFRQTPTATSGSWTMPRPSSARQAGRCRPCRSAMRSRRCPRSTWPSPTACRPRATAPARSPRPP
jgi:putative long chain acyl-CoA synthase